MNLGAIISYFRIPHLATQMKLGRDAQSFLRLNFLNFAVETGLLKILNRPASKDQIIQRLSVQRAELLDGILDLGISLRELSCKNGLYEISGKRSKALVAANGDPISALVQEYVTYYGSVYRHLPERLRGAPLGDYLEKTADMVGRSSRIVEPLVGDYVKTVVKKVKAARILEVGCGSGIYLKYATEGNPEIGGVAIDMQEEMVNQTSANLLKWGISDRFEVIAADIRDSHPSFSGPFDLVTMINNIYYFPAEDRLDLFRQMRSRISDNGGLAIVSIMKGASIISRNFDLVVRSTVGCFPLPETEEFNEQLSRSGFKRIERTKLAIGEPFYGILAR